MKKLAITIVTAMAATAAFAQRGNIGFVYPAGAKQGSVIELTVGGQNLSKATGIIVSGEGVSGELIPVPNAAKKKGKGRKKKDIGEEDNLQLADQVKFRLTIAPDAPLGMRNVRLLLPNGQTNRLYFEVGEIPDVLEKPKDVLSAVSETLPVCFNGQIMRSDIDRFRFKAQKGKDLVIRVKGREFVPYIADAVPGWFQPIIRLYGPDGKEIAYNDDYRYNVDPVLVFKVPQTGYYDVEINDALFRGREDFVYRISVGELPFITGITPLGSRPGKKVQMEVRGVNLRSHSLKFKAGKEGVMQISVKGKNGLTSNSLGFDVSSMSEYGTKKLKPNSSRNAAWTIEEGTVVEQNFSSKLQQHWYIMNVEKPHLINIDIRARRLGAPTDARLTVFDSGGNVIQDVDDTEDPDEPMMTHFADPSVCFKIPMGIYYIRVMESQGNFGEDYSYRLSVDMAKPDFSLHIEPSIITVPEDGTGIFNVEVGRKQNFKGPIDINIEGLPKGFKVHGNTIKQGQKKTFVSITAPSGAEHKTIVPKVIGTAADNDLSISRTAVPAESMMQAFYYTHLMPVDEFRVEVDKAQPFKLIPDNLNGRRFSLNGPNPVKVRIVRTPGFNSPVTVMIKSNGNIKAEAEVIPEGETECVLQVNVKNNAFKEKEVSVYFSGVVKATSKRIAGKGRNSFVASVTANSPVQNVIIEGNPNGWKQGGKAAKAKKTKKK